MRAGSCGPGSAREAREWSVTVGMVGVTREQERVVDVFYKGRGEVGFWGSLGGVDVTFVDIGLHWIGFGVCIALKEGRGDVPYCCFSYVLSLRPTRKEARPSHLNRAAGVYCSCGWNR